MARPKIVIIPDAQCTFILHLHGLPRRREESFAVELDLILLMQEQPALAECVAFDTGEDLIFKTHDSGPIVCPDPSRECQTRSDGDPAIVGIHQGSSPQALDQDAPRPSKPLHRHHSSGLSRLRLLQRQENIALRRSRGRFRF